MRTDGRRKRCRARKGSSGSRSGGELGTTCTAAPQGQPAKWREESDAALRMLSASLLQPQRCRNFWTSCCQLKTMMRTWYWCCRRKRRESGHAQRRVALSTQSGAKAAKQQYSGAWRYLPTLRR